MKADTPHGGYSVHTHPNRLPSVNRNYLLESLGIEKGKLPADLCRSWQNVPLRDRMGTVIGHTAVLILPSNTKGKSRRGHRIEIACPRCSAFIPCGRLWQHSVGVECLKAHQLKVAHQLLGLWPVDRTPGSETWGAAYEENMRKSGL